MLMQRADVAMYQAKEGRTGVELYAPELDGNSVAAPGAGGRPAHGARARGARPALPAEGRPARPDAVVGVEALLRWEHPVHGWLSPDEFIPLAEQTGLIVPLTDCVFDHALRQMARLARPGPRHRRRGQPVGAHAARARPPRPHRGHVPALGRAHRRAWCSRSPRAWSWPTRRARCRSSSALRALGVDDRGRRLRHRLLLAGLPQAPAGRRAQDRPLVRHGDGDRRARRGDRALDDRPRPQPRAARRRRGRRDARRPRAPDQLGCDQAQGYSYSRALPAAEFTAWLAAREHAALAISA